jgi:hypothetical protein
MAHVSILVKDGRLKASATVEIEQGVLDPPYLELKIDNFADSDHRNRVTLHADEAEAVVSALSLAIKHARAAKRGG